jgi:hypothetical protein
MGNCRKWDAFL